MKNNTKILSINIEELTKNIQIKSLTMFTLGDKLSLRT
jgi:hypothetical protein